MSASSAPSENNQEDISLEITDYTIEQTSTRYLLPHSMKLFFLNGGGACYVISVGDYDTDIQAAHFTRAIDLLRKEQEPTMIVMPDLMNLSSAEGAYQVQNYALDHCGDKTQNRITIMDIYGTDSNENPAIENFRQGMFTDYPSWGAAYYPWLNTTIVSEDNLSYKNINEESRPIFIKILTQELKKSLADKKRRALMQEVVDRIEKTTSTQDDQSDTTDHKALMQLSAFYRSILAVMHKNINRLPPSAAMAGMYTMVDNSRGVWKAPANVSLNSVISPSLNITEHEQQELNAPHSGKSVNAIRSFVGEGTLVWGARTLDGHSSEWKYVNVRRTMIMLEQSIQLATRAYAFEPNGAKTWKTIKAMIGNYLTGVWKRGGLAGATPEEAYSVRVGLGETMTDRDISKGILRVSVLVAITRPAEFLEIAFQQTMQEKS